MGRLRIALCQLDAVVGDIDGNVQMALQAMADAEDAGADLAVLPELFLTGYPPEDLLLEPGFVDASQGAFAQVAAASRRCTTIVGFVDAGIDLHNAAGVVASGQVQGVCHKVVLPNYGVFDERRWFSPGLGDSPLFSVAGTRVGVAVCEDAWTPRGPLDRLALGGAELIVTLNASPFRTGVLDERRAMLSTRAADLSCALVYLNLVGGQDEVVFDGGSMVFDQRGQLVASADEFRATTLVVDVEVRAAYRKRAIDPRGRAVHPPLPVVATTVPWSEPPRPARRPTLAPPLEPVEQVYRALHLGLADYVTKNGFDEVVVGLSGGVDSALVAVVATDALGPARVHTVSMPSRFSSRHSLDDAADLAGRLGLDHRVLPIEGPHAAFLAALAEPFAGRPEDLAEENLQARVRGTLLMALSNKLGWLVLTTGNKSELAVGYATLYGDMAGGFAVIKDVPKTLVYDLCRFKNATAGKEIVPQSILDKAPSAELRPDQRDEDSLPPYPVLDPIIEGYVEQDLSVAELVAAGHDEATVRRVIDMIDRAEYKRRQAPPGVRVTSRAFGKDRRMPITNRFRASRLPVPPAAL